MTDDPEAEAAYEEGSAALTAADARRMNDDPEAAKALYQQAVSSFDRALAQAPDFGPAHLGRAYGLGMLGAVDEATHEFQHAAALQEDLRLAALHFNGHVLELSGRTSEALEYYEAAEALAPENPTMHQNVGDLRLALGDNQGAEEAFSHVLELDGTSPNAYLARAFARTNLGELDAAAADVDRALDVLRESEVGATEYAKLFLAAGEARVRLGDDEGAREAFSGAIEADPRLAAAYTGRAAVAARRGDYESAVSDYGAVLVIEPANLEAHRLRGIYLEALGRPSEALSDYEEATALGGGEAEDFRNRADAKRSLGRTDDAIADYTKALELEPNHMSALDARGRLLGSKGDWEGAAADFARLIEAAPWNSDAHRMHGIYLEALGRYEEALADYETVIRLGSDEAEDYRNRADAAYSLGRETQALADYNAAIERDPSLAAAYLGRANAQARLGDTEGALRDYETSLSYDPESSEAFTGRAEMFTRMGEHERAVTDYKRALELEPDNVSIHRNLVRAQFEVGDAFSARGLLTKWRRSYERALESVARGLSVAPDDPWLHGYAATSHRVLAAYDHGVEAATKALACPGADDPVLGGWLLRERGDCRRQWGEGGGPAERFEEALSDFEQAAEVAGESAESLIFEYWGHALVGLERFPEALAKFDAAVDRDPDGAWPLIGKGKAHYYLGEFEDAEAAFDRVIASGADDLKTYGNVGRGLALAGRGSELEADEAFAAALGVDGGAAGYYERAERFVYLRAFERAESDFRQAIALDENHADALNELAWMFVNDWPRPDRLEEAYELAKKVVALDPDAPNRSAYLDTAGWIALQTGRVEEARELLDEAVSLNPHDVVIRSHHAETMAALGEQEEALADSRRRA